MDIPFFRSVDNASGTDFFYHRPDELISFSELLLRWSSLSFFKIPFFTVMRRVGEDFGFYMRLFEAYSIAFSDTLPGGVSETTRESEYMEDGTQKTHRKNARPRQKTEAELEADRMYVYLRLQSPFTFRLRYEHLYENFGRLYFLRSEVEGIEKAYPECRITDMRFENPSSGAHSSLYKTTEKNIADVGGLTLYRMASCPDLPKQHPGTFRTGLLCPETGAWWGCGDGEDRAETSFPIPYLPTILTPNLWPDIPVAMPESPKKSRGTKLKNIWPKIAVLKRLGVREQEKMAKIIYALHPFLTDEEIGRLLPAKPGTKTSKETDRDRGRILLGKKKLRKPSAKTAESHT